MVGAGLINGIPVQTRITENSARGVAFVYGIAGGIEIRGLRVLGGQFMPGTAKLGITHSFEESVLQM